jgi:hypothetical protein
LLTFNGTNPNAVVLGRGLREIWEADNPAIFPLPLEVAGADALEIATRTRISAKAATLQTIAEDRLTRANSSKPHALDDKQPEPGHLIDIFRNPTTKDIPGWRGPAVLLDLDDYGSATVKWQGRPFSIPLRHIRNHVGFALALFSWKRIDFECNVNYDNMVSAEERTHVWCNYIDSQLVPSSR